jgi:voltage-gated potassium channel
MAEDRQAQAGASHRFGRPEGGWRLRFYTVIFGTDTPAGRLFDQLLIVAILLSVAVVMADSVQSLHEKYQGSFQVIEWGFTLLFTVEYVARLACVNRPLRYATSFFGVVDLLSILPTYLAVLFPEAQAFVDVRILRLLRMFRVLKLTAYVWEYQAMGRALVASRRKILVFLSAVLMIVVVMGTVMYVVEGPENGFTSIPVSVYWAITTMTTVGFGDITPKTDIGRTIASLMMLVGWGTLAVPTGIVTAEMTARRMRATPSSRRCSQCGAGGHLPEAAYCLHCGAALPARGAADPAAGP